MRRVFTFISLFLLVQAGIAQNKIKNYHEVIDRFYHYFSDESSVNPSGGLILDMGSRSAGRVAFNIKHVSISMEKLPERPGCADICPPMTLIKFKCNEGKECITDPAFEKLGKTSKSSITYNIDKGTEAYNFLLELQQYFKTK